MQRLRRSPWRKKQDLCRCRSGCFVWTQSVQGGIHSSGLCEPESHLQVTHWMYTLPDSRDPQQNACRADKIEARSRTPQRFDHQGWRYIDAIPPD